MNLAGSILRQRLVWQARIWRMYGLTPEDVAHMWEKQAGRCPLCFVPLETKVWVIEHEHVKGFKKMPPEQKAQYFRGLLDGWCNHRVLSMIERAGAMRVWGALTYLGWDGLL